MTNTCSHAGRTRLNSLLFVRVLLVLEIKDLLGDDGLGCPSFTSKYCDRVLKSQQAVGAETTASRNAGTGRTSQRQRSWVSAPPLPDRRRRLVAFRDAGPVLVQLPDLPISRISRSNVHIHVRALTAVDALATPSSSANGLADQGMI